MNERAIAHMPGRTISTLTPLQGSILQRRATKQTEPTSVPPIVHDVLRSPGQPLDPGTRAFMESRFGHDFSQVQVHTDAMAAESARAMNSLAYTVGSNIVFNTGEYKPYARAGEKLLAHELTHTVQQRSTGEQSTSTETNLSINNDYRLEAEAERAASGSSTIRLGNAISGHLTRSLQRQGGASGVTVRSPVFEETVTQAATVAGANVGRPLTRAERALARPVFGNSLDYDRIRLIPTSLLEYRTVANNILIPEDFTISDAYMAQTLIHELTHVWQYQHHGTSYISVSLGRQISAAVSRGSRNFAYDYQIRAGQSFFDFAPEQQAFIVENYFSMLRDRAAIARARTGGPTRTYRSNHLGSDGFKRVLSAADRQSEITRELPLHQLLISQMQQALPRSEVDLLNQRAMDVIRMPGEELFPVPEEQRTLPIRPAFELRF